MSTDLITVREDDLVLFADRLLKWNDHDTLPVENIRGRVIGLLSLKDIERERASDQDHDSALVKDWMQDDIVTIGPESSIEKAKKALKLNDSQCLPVVKDGSLVGVITKSDIRALKERT